MWWAVSGACAVILWRWHVQRREELHQLQHRLFWIVKDRWDRDGMLDEGLVRWQCWNWWAGQCRRLTYDVWYAACWMPIRRLGWQEGRWSSVSGECWTVEELLAYGKGSVSWRLER